MSILSSTAGSFHFLDKDYNDVIFTDWNDIPEDFEFSHMIKFLPDIPPPPHTVQQHVEIHMWNERFQTFMERERCQQQHA